MKPPDDDSPIFHQDWLKAVDPTLPPDHVKFLNGDDRARVYAFDLENETGKLVAEWPET